MIPLIAALGALGAGGLLSRRSDMTGKDPGMIGGVLQDLYRSSSFASAGNYRRAQQFQAEQQQQQQQEQQAQQKRQLLAQAGFPTEAAWTQNITPEEVQSQLVQYQRALGGNQATAQYNLEAPQRALDAYEQQLGIMGKELGIQQKQQALAQAGQPPQVKAPAGYMVAEDGQSVVPIPGTKEAEARRMQVAALDQLEGNVSRMYELIDQFGSEMFGETAGTMSALHGAVLGGLKDMYELGVLQQGDIEYLSRLAPDPTSFTAARTSRGRLKSQYDELRRQIEDRVMMNMGYMPE